MSALNYDIFIATISGNSIRTLANLCFTDKETTMNNNIMDFFTRIMQM